MTINESNLLMTLFFAQHKGKRLCDVIKGHRNKYVIAYTNNKTLSGGLCIRTNNGEQILWYNEYFEQISSIVTSDKEDLNLLDYISFEDKV